MDSFHHLFQGLAVILTLQNLYYCVLGSLVGTLVGVLPGIGPLAALSLFPPVTFNLPAVSGSTSSTRADPQRPSDTDLCGVRYRRLPGGGFKHSSVITLLGPSSRGSRGWASG